MKAPLLFLLTSAAFAFVSGAGAATVMATDFAGSTNTGVTIHNIRWSGDYPGVFTGGTATLSTQGPGVITGPGFSDAAARERVGANLNVQTASGYAEGDAVWSADYTIGYAFDSETALVDLSSVSLTGFAVSSSGVIQTQPREVDFRVSVLDASGGKVFATGTHSVMIPAGCSSGLGCNVALVGETRLNAAKLGGRTGSFVLRVEVVKPAETMGNFVQYDNLAIQGVYKTVPEPSSYGLMGAGALAAAVIVRRRRKVA